MDKMKLLGKWVHRHILDAALHNSSPLVVIIFIVTTIFTLGYWTASGKVSLKLSSYAMETL